MERTQRIARINALVSRPQGVTLQQLMEDMEVSRATINRDLQLMRDQMSAPIVWDERKRAYQLEPNGANGPTYMLPGQWFTPAQAYAFLTLQNMVEKIAPNVLGPFLDPMRGLLKTMLCEAEFRFYGLDRKINIDMPNMPAIGDLDFQNLIEALLHEQAARIIVCEPSKQEHEITAVPIRLHISATSWRVEIKQLEETQSITVDVGHIRKVVARDEAGI